MGVKQIQTNFTSGVFDSLLSSREDIAYYFNGLKDARNLLLLPAGGVTARPGGQHVRELSRQLQAVDLATATITTPHGGTGANLIDGNDTTFSVTTDNLSSTNPFVVFHVTLASALTISAVDLINAKLSSDFLLNEMFVQYSTDDAAWHNYGTALDLDVTDRSRRRRDAAGPVTARYWRFVRIGATSVSAMVAVSGFKMWIEGTELSDGRFLPFASSASQISMMVLSDKNIDNIVGDDYVGSVGVPHTSDQVTVVNSAQKLDTMLLYHPAVKTLKLFRQDGDDEFDFRPLIRTNIPKYDYGAGVGGVNAKQVLSVVNTANGDKFTLELEGEVTTAITVGASAAATATAIQTALRALPSIGGTGITVTDVTGGFEITFGGDQGKRPWLELKIFVLSGNGVWDTAITVDGEPEGEDIMSDTRGWPGCGVFYLERLHEGGVMSLPHAWLASVVADYYNFDTELDLDTKGLLFRPDTDQVSAIYQIFPGRDLTFFTNDTEFYNTVEPITEKAVMKLATRSGSKQGMRIHEVDGALVFIQGVKDEASGREIGTCVREFIYDITVQNYQANILSKLSSALIKNPVDVGLRKALSTGEADILLLVNEDGTGTAYTIARTQDVNAFMPIDTREGDRFLAIGVDKNRRVYFLVERIINGVARRFIEKWNDDLLLDGGNIVRMTYEEKKAATNGQAAFTWTFDNPADAEMIGVRIDGGRLQPDQYSVNLGTKTITLSDDIAETVLAPILTSPGRDPGTTIRISSMVKEITGLDYLKGETVQTVIDGTEGDDYSVGLDGTLELAEYADTEIQFGFDYVVWGEMLPYRIPGSGTLAGKKMRNVSAVLSLEKTGGIEIRANGGRWKPVPLLQMDAPILDRSTAELLYTGEKVIQGLLGCAVGAPFEFRRPGPCKFTVKAITREVVA